MILKGVYVILFSVLHFATYIIFDQWILVRKKHVIDNFLRKVFTISLWMLLYEFFFFSSYLMGTLLYNEMGCVYTYTRGYTINEPWRYLTNINWWSYINKKSKQRTIFDININVSNISVKYSSDSDIDSINL